MIKGVSGKEPEEESKYSAEMDSKLLSQQKSTLSNKIKTFIKSFKEINSLSMLLRVENSPSIRGTRPMHAAVNGNYEEV